MTPLRWLLLLVGVTIVALVPTQLKSYGVYLATLWCVYLIAGLGLNLTVGYAGQISLGQAAFLGIGAYCAAIMAKAGVPYLLVAAK